MQVEAAGRIEMTPLHSMFPYQRQAQSCIPDLLARYSGSTSQGMSWLRVDPIAGCVHAKQVLVPFHQKLKAGHGLGAQVVDEDDWVNADLPALEWEDVALSANALIHFFRGVPWGQQYFDVLWNGTGNDTDTTFSGSIYFRDTDSTEDPQPFLVKAQGFLVLLERSLPTNLSKTVAPWFAVQFVIGSYLYSVIFGNAEYVTVQRATNDGSVWGSGAVTLAMNLKLAGDTAIITNNHGAKGSFPLDVRFLNGIVQISAGGATANFSVPHPSTDTLVDVTPVAGYNNTWPLISEIHLRGAYFWRLRGDVFLHRWATASWLRGMPISLGFIPETQPYYTLMGASGVQKLASGQEWHVNFPSGSILKCSAYGSWVTSEHNYKLDLTNEQSSDISGEYEGVDFADLTAVATRVDVRTDGIWVASPAMGRNLIPKNRVVERIRFDPNALTVHHSLEFNVDNWYGQWAGMSGARAISLDLGYASPATLDYVKGSPAPNRPGNMYRRFTGMARTFDFEKMEANRATLSICCTDLMPVLNQAMGSVPVMDGWNHYAAIAWVLEKCGIPRSMMAFQALIPSDPYSSAPGDPEPYFLPMGYGINAWTPRNRMMTGRDLIEYIRRVRAWLFYIDAQAYFRYERWIPETRGTAVKTFYEDPKGGSGASDWGKDLAEFRHFRFRTSVENVRNVILLIGIDVFSNGWNPIISKREDAASILAAPGAEPSNYVGYRAPLVWVDSRFASLPFASSAANRLLAMLRIPEWEVQIETWMQPQLYPMDTIWVSELRSGAALVPFYIMEMTNSWTLSPQGPQDMTSQITGRFLI